VTGGHQTGGDQRLPGRSKLGSLLPPMEEISKEELPSLCWNSFLRSFRGAPGDEKPRFALAKIQSEIPRLALSRITSFPRKPEPIVVRTNNGPPLSRGDEAGDFHPFGWAAGPCTLGMTARIRFSPGPFSAVLPEDVGTSRRTGRLRDVVLRSRGLLAIRPGAYEGKARWPSLAADPSRQSSS